jgi:PKD repeat protein
LADNGGLTLTHTPLEDSPAIDAGDDNSCPAKDQRGALRPFDGDGSGQATCDIGAVEYGSPTAPRAALTATPTLVEPGWPVQFQDISEGAVDSRLWEFGDGITSTLPSPSHAYTQTGSYSVTLTVYSAIGDDSVTYPDYIQVIEEVYRQLLPTVIKR